MNKFLLLFLSSVFLWSCGEREEVSYTEVSFSEIPSWSKSNINDFYDTFISSCTYWNKKTSDEFLLNEHPTLGRFKDWQRVCSLPSQKADVVHFFEENFKALKVESKSKSLFTGYYSPELKAKYQRTPDFNIPLYGKPKNLYTSDLGLFYDDLKGRKIVGRIQGNRFVPYYTRSEIKDVKGFTPILWLNSEIDKFFLQIQGSGYVDIDGVVRHVSYAANNGHTYVAIGGVLIENGVLDRENVSMQKIREWLELNPSKQQDIFNKNPRYIFFNLNDNETRGSLGIPLQAEKSLAVDPRYIPLGVPVWVSTTVTSSGEVFEKPLLAADTGGAIKGPVRGDIYFGHGKEAEEKAGFQAEGGHLFVIVPR